MAAKKQGNTPVDDQAAAERDFALAVKTEQNTALSTAVEMDLEADAGVGSQTISKDDMALPFLVVLQDLSPQTKKSKGEYVQGATPGMFLNSVTGQIWPGETGLLFVPSLYQKTFIEWVPKDAGGGFVADHGLVAGQKLADHPDTKRDRGLLILANDNHLVETAYHFGLVVDENTGEAAPALLTMKSTSLKVSRKWNTLAMGIRLPGRGGQPFTPALSYMTYRLTTKEVSNDKGTWSEIVVTPYKPTPQLDNGAALYRQAVDFAKMMATQPLPIDPQAAEAANAAEGGEEGVSKVF